MNVIRRELEDMEKKGGRMEKGENRNREEDRRFVNKMGRRIKVRREKEKIGEDGKESEKVGKG